MAKQSVEVLVDDIDGTPLFGDQGRTVTLVLDDRTAELDLSNEHIEELEQALAPYFRASLEGPTPRPQPRPTSNRVVAPRTVADRRGLQEIRKWAKKNGFKVSERGRIPFSVMDAYTKAHMPLANRS